ncbi:MAG: hypothetical protein PHD67_08530 [Oscillospiraceae bacterium]|nr:hypothetical protein [Oscillospiraceae bacterium]
MPGISKRTLSRAVCAAACACCMAAAVGLLLFPREIQNGVREGLILCGEALIPSLLPFMILSEFLIRSPVAAPLERALKPAATHLFRLPECAAVPLLMGAVGGYPVAGRAIAGLLEQKAVSPQTAQRMLGFCVNAGPAFLLGAVGVGMFGSLAAGGILLTAQILSSLLLGFFFSRGKRPEPAAAKRPALPFSAALVQAVDHGVSGVLGICGYVLAFSAVIAALKACGMKSGFPAALLSGILEVTTGCLGARELGGLSGLLLAAFLISFSGISVVCQVFSFFPPGKISFVFFLGSRILHGSLTCGLTLLLIRLFPQAAEAAYAFAGYRLVPFSHTPLLSCVMLLLCAAVLTGGEFTLSLRAAKKIVSREDIDFKGGI